MALNVNESVVVKFPARYWEPKGPVQAGYKSGSDLFLAKPIICGELAAAILSIASRKTVRDAPYQKAAPPVHWVLERIKWKLVSPRSEEIPLTAKEFQLLQLLTALPGEPVLREKLLQELYSGGGEYNSRALDNLVRRLRRKIEQHTGADPLPRNDGQSLIEVVKVLFELLGERLTVERQRFAARRGERDTRVHQGRVRSLSRREQDLRILLHRPVKAKKPKSYRAISVLDGGAQVDEGRARLLRRGDSRLLRRRP
ncbi:MAG: winged helix-turn-helix domain-containing protein, partial [Myxococcales bacterium]